jgi:alpha-L-fucosidase
VRFTQTEDAFYILSLSQPTEEFVINAALPILEGDVITMIGAGNDTEAAWTPEGEGISINVPSALTNAGKYCWVFKIEYFA